ncbi:FtsX-like permease family protein [Roseivirga echinicomitans]
MLSSFFRIAFRHLVKNKLYSILNVFGLTVGLICFVILSLYVKEQFDRDAYHSHSNEIYRVLVARDDTTGVEPKWEPYTQFPMAELFKEGIPEVKNIVRFGQDTELIIEAEQRKFKTQFVHFADPSLFDVFDFSVIAASKPLNQQSVSEIILVKSEAEKFFDSAETAINQTIKLNGYGDFKVIGVIADLGQETHMDFKFILPLAQSDKAYGDDRGYRNWNVMSAFPLYVQIDENAEIAIIEAKAKALLQSHLKNTSVRLEPVGDVYFSKLHPFFKKTGDRQFIRLYLLIGVLILFIACINYTNLSTARYLKRAKEVGIRKTVGGYRSQIIAQFFIESIALSSIAVILSMCFIEILLPLFNTFAGSSIKIDYQNPYTYLVVLSAILGIGVFAGLYPAVFLSRFSATQILSGSVTKGKAGLLFRNILVVVQFFICIGLFIATNVIFKQFNHLKGLDLGLDKDQVIMIPLNDEDIKKSYQAFKNELSSNPSVEWVTGAGPKMFGGQAQFYLEIEGSDDVTPISIFPVDADFFQKFDIGLIEGKLFQSELGKEANNFLIVNEALAKVGGWEITDKMGKNVFKADVGVPNLGGVVEDFVFFSVKDEVTPAAYLYKPNDNNLAYVKVKPENMKATIASIQASYEKFANLYPFEYSFLDQEFAAQYAQEQRLANIFTTFSGVAILIALLGLFGLTIFLAEQRLKEFSIRKVLGASQIQLIWLMNSGISRMLLISTALVIPLVYYFLDDWINTFAFRIVLDWSLFVLPVVLVMLFAWLTTLYQSIHSARINPVDSLRNE